MNLLTVGEQGFFFKLAENIVLNQFLIKMWTFIESFWIKLYYQKAK